MGSLQVYRLTKNNTSHQHRYCCKQGRTLLSSAVVRYQLWFRQDKHLWAFGCYLLLLYFYSSAVGGRHSNEFPACSNTRPLAATLPNDPANIQQTKKAKNQSLPTTPKIFINFVDFTCPLKIYL